MAKEQIRDIIILLPGIMGSVLQKDGRDLWAISGQAIWSALTTLGKSVEQLLLENDDIDSDELADGITANRLISDVHLIPGLIKIDGYTAISRMITSRFDVIKGQTNDNSPANFFEFPYDWRRDCRVAARQLKKIIDFRLPQWREYSGATDAKVILIGHSMGGLVSRHYLEMLDGWKNCKALITFGTPYRGSVNALNYLGNGYKKMFIDFSEIIKSFTGIYQLLPTFRTIRVGNEYKRVTEVKDVPGVDYNRGLEALKFHNDIKQAVEENRKNLDYRDNGYKIFPIVGIKQPSFQSAQIINGKTVVSKDIPQHIDHQWGGGDGTVPMISAIPPELTNEYRDTFFAERHGSIQNNDEVLEQIYKLIKRMQLANLSDFLGETAETKADEKPAISLDLDDLYVQNEEPVLIRARLLNTKSQGNLKAIIESADGLTLRREFQFAEDSEGLLLNSEDSKGFLLNSEKLPKGLYRIGVEAFNSGVFPPPVHDVFEVA